jgi:2-dehydro-3-deoxygluconokinase
MMTQQLMKEAKKRKVKISFDINYRAKLWNYSKAKKVLSTLLPLVDYCSARKLDAVHLLGIEEQSRPFTFNFVTPHFPDYSP